MSNDDYDFDNHPELGKYFDGDRSYPSTQLAEYEDSFGTIAIVMTSGYYADACIDIVDREDFANEILGYVSYYASKYREDMVSDVCHFLRCSKNFVLKHLKGCDIRKDDYEYKLEKAFESMVEDLRDIEVEKANKIVNKIKKAYGFRELGCTVIFSNGEALYDFIG